MIDRIIESLRVLKRKFYILKYGLRNVHSTFIATSGCHIAKDLKAGAYSFIGPRCIVYPNVCIGKYTMIANDTMVLGGDHNYKKVELPMIFSGRDSLKPTLIGDDVWIGARCIIMAGVKIGNGAIVAAGSIVTKDVPPYYVVGGNPAKFIKMRFNDDEIKDHEIMLSHDYKDFDKSVFRILRKHCN